jgi:glutamyl-tRNA synthetase
VTDRVRFAPSPTGFLHVGSARTALFNWLHARATGGTFVLRVEDTDAERNRGEVLDVLFRELEWLGIDWDEGPLFQSERRDNHRAAVEQLLSGGRAYLCDADNNEVDGDSITDGLAVRFRVDKAGHTEFADLIRGDMSFPNDTLEDFVIWRSNGSPPFLLANAVDDADMNITHAIRGEDLLSGAPKVLQILDALGRERPTYAHLPLLVNEQRKKLSKRRDDVSLASYRERGFLAEAMANYLALLGWGPPDDIEIRPMSEIVELFNISDVNKAAAFFDVKKLEHFNGTYIRQLTPAAATERVMPWIDTGDQETIERYMPLVQEKLRVLSDIPPYVDFLFAEPVSDEPSWEKAMLKGPAVEILDAAIEQFATCAWDADTIKNTVLEIGEANEVKLGKAQAPIRVAVTGRTVGPPLFETLADFFDRETVIARMRVARAKL